MSRFTTGHDIAPKGKVWKCPNCGDTQKDARDFSQATCLITKVLIDEPNPNNS